MSACGKFKCEMCGGEFEKIRADAEAFDEKAEGPYSHVEDIDCAIVCDDCYRRLGSPNEPVPPLRM